MTVTTEQPPAQPSEPESEELASRKGRQRPFSVLGQKDRRTLAAMTFFPTFLHVALIWVPALGTFILSFTNWNGVRFGNIKWVALAACIAAALVGAGLWGWGFAQGNTVGSSRGRVFVGGGLIGAFLIAIGPALVNQLAGF